MLISKADIRRLSEAAIDAGCCIEVEKDGVKIRFSPNGQHQSNRVVSLDDLYAGSAR